MIIEVSSTWPQVAWLLPGAVLYVEMHYRWWPLPSRYFRREPEILADAPHRLEPGRHLPLLLLVKDAHRYPLRLDRVEVRLDTDQEQAPSEEFSIGEMLSGPWWHRIIMLDRPRQSGDVSLWVTFHYTVRGKARSCVNHNLPALRPTPLRVHLASEPLPGEDVVWGDLHTHTALTDDMIEFGSPLEATRAAATALGLGFVCATDHSYDLDDLPGQWRASDPKLTKWHTSRQQIAQLNTQEGGALIVPGEEVSVRNTLDRNIHTLVLGHPHFLPGSGDGGERLSSRRSELDLPGLVQALAGESTDGNSAEPNANHPGVAIAAHPYAPVPFAQWAILNRGLWQKFDALTPGISGLQILNGQLDPGFFHGVAAWIELLLQGHRKFIYAGSDAHGDFNLHRQIRLLFMSLWERGNHVMGTCRTGVLGAPPGDMNAILAGLAAGRCIISNGPFINLTATSNGRTAAIGETLQAREATVRLELASTEEFGPLAGYRLIRGRVGAADEETVVEAPLEGEQLAASWSGTVTVGAGTTYLRGEVESWLPEGRRAGGEAADQRGLAMTNPLWLEASNSHVMGPRPVT